MVAVWEREPIVGAEEVLAAVFFERYSSLVGLARLMLDRREEAEEVVQEAFARTLEGWSRLRSTDDAYPYVRRAVVNLSRSGLRRRAVARRAVLSAVPDGVPADVPVLASETRREVLSALAALPRRQRECVVLRYFEECSTAETAAVLGVTEGAVKTHLHRGLAAMEAKLEATR